MKIRLLTLVGLSLLVMFSNEGHAKTLTEDVLLNLWEKKNALEKEKGKIGTGEESYSL